MASQVEEPSQAERLEAVADAGPGASDKSNIPGDPLSIRPANGILSDDHSAPASSPSDIEKKDIEDGLPSSEKTADGIPSDGNAAPPDKQKSANEDPPRSKMKVFLIMLSLMIAVFLAALDTTIITTVYLYLAVS